MMDTNRAAQKEKMTKMIRGWIDQFAHVIQSTDTKEFVQVLVLDPFLKYMMGQIFPYIIIAFCLFGAVFIFVILTFVLLLYRAPTASAASATAAVAAVAAVCPFCVGKA